MKRIVFFIFLALTLNTAKSQIVINEVCWTNQTTTDLLAGSGISGDYIELYNATPGFTLSLNNYYLTNSKTNLYMWKIPSGLTLGPGQYMTFWCTGRDTVEAAFPYRRHTNFTIEQCSNQWVMLTRSPGVIADSIFVRRTKAGDTWGRFPDGNPGWKLFNQGATIPANFDGSNWVNVPAASVYLGYAPVPTFTTPPTAGFTTPVTGNYDMVIPDTVNFQINFTRGDCGAIGGEIPCASYTGCPGGPTSAITYTYQDGITTPIPMSGVTSVITAVTYPKPNGVGSASLANLYLPSFAETNTYFEGADVAVNPGFGVLSIVTNTNFFNVGGTSTVHCEYFDQNKFYSEVGGSLTQPPNDGWLNQQRGFDVGFDDETGEGCRITGYVYNDANFGTSTRTVFPNFEVRAAGKDNFSALTPTLSTPPPLRTTHLRDAFAQTYAMKNGLAMEGMHYKPIRTFVNGCYWGIYEFREIPDQNYLNYYFGQDIDSVDILRQHGVGSVLTNNLDTAWVTQIPSIATSSLGIFNATRLPVIAATPYYNNAMKRLSKFSMMDFWIYNSYLVNADLPVYNLSWWRKTNNGALIDTLMKWRYFMWDMNNILDIGVAPKTLTTTNMFVSPCAYTSSISTVPTATNGPASFTTTASAYAGHPFMLKMLQTNTQFRNDYMNRYMDLLNTTLRCDRMLSHLNYFKQVFTPEIPLHAGYWAVSPPDWDMAMDTLRYRLTTRCAKIDSMIKSNKCNNLNGPFNITIDVEPSGAGTVDFNSLHLTNFAWTGQYYQFKFPTYITSYLEAWPTDTSLYVFDHWEFTAPTNSTTVLPWAVNENNYLYKDSVSFVIGESDHITAVFVDKRNDIVLPTGFTPNGDGINDIFSPLGAQARYARDYEMQVWNRWGQEVFRANEYHLGWDGMYNGQQAQTGVYAYILKYKNVLNEYKVVKGNVTLIR